ncbi:MAG: major facilitator transporter [Chloroflexi bacterium]|nr:major facilitator transporter [Chloroflexota bacterium]
MEADSGLEQGASHPPREARQRRPPLWSWGYGFLLVAVFLAYFGQQLITPTLPLYITDLGGSPVVAGLVIAAFSITSFPMRPFVGYLSDAWSSRGVLTLGILILTVTSFGFFVPVMGVLAAINAVRGLGWAGLNTAGYTVLTRTAARERRGEASGYYNLATALPISLAPALALWIITVSFLGFYAVFLLSAACAGAALAVAWGLRWAAPRLETQDGPKPKMSVHGALIGSIDTRVFLAAGLLLTTTVTQVATGAFLPLYAREIGVDGIGAFFIVVGVIGAVSQLLGGRFLDRGGRGWWLLAGFVFMILAMLVLFVARSLEVILLAGVVHAIGSTIINTMLLVVAMDLSDPHRPGAGMATYSMAYQLGAALGAPIFGLIIEYLGFGAMFLGSALAMSFGLVATLARWSALDRPAPSTAATK